MKLATYVRKLKDRSGNYIVPATRSTGVYLSDNQTLQTWADNVKSWLQKHDGKFDNLYNQLGLDGSAPNWITFKLYAKGSVVMWADKTSPAALYGGSWTRIKGAYIRAGNDSDSPGWIGGSDTRTLTASNIPTLSTQIMLTPGGYCGANKYPHSFVLSSKDPSVVNNNLFGDLNGQPSDRIEDGSYKNSNLVRYYNSNVQPISVQPKMCNLYVWYRVS